MEFDVVTIVAIILALVVGFAFYYLYNRYRCDMVDDVYDILRSIWENYGVKLKEDNPTLYAELESAIQELDKAMADKEITIMEAFDIAKALLPLAKRLSKYIKDHYA